MIDKKQVLSFPEENYRQSSVLLNSGIKYNDEEFKIVERMFTAYRAIVIMLFNYAQSGHPGGSISAGRVILNLMLNENSKFDITDLDRPDSDVIGFAAGHKALGLYSFLGLLFEIVKLKDPKLYNSIGRKMRFEDLLGFRKNAVTELPLLQKFNSKRLDGHPTPETPGVVLATGASGVGLGAFGGYAFAKREFYDSPPVVNIIEGEGGMTPGRVHENLAHFWALSLWNLIIHVDWNNASIDADSVCTENGPGQYVNWQPQELGLLHGYNVVFTENGMENNHIKVSHDYVFSKYMPKKQHPNMIVYRTLKGEGYIEGRKSHGGGFKYDSTDYFNAQKIFESTFNVKLVKTPEPNTPELREEYLYKNFLVIENALKSDEKLLEFGFNRLISNRDGLNRENRKPKTGSANVGVLFNNSALDIKTPPAEVFYKPGSSITLRESLGKTLNYFNHYTKGGFFGFAADLVGSTSLNLLCSGFKEGFIGAENPFAKIIPTGICEDGGSSIVAGISATGHYVGVGSSYATFISPMAFTAARLYCIAYQAKRGKNMAPLILINAHAGLKTGEDGPTHACPQPLSMWKSFSELNLKVITLTPWDPNEIWPLMIASMKNNPALIIPFVTRPSEVIIDRQKYLFPDVSETANGIYYVRKAKKSKATVLYQGAEVGIELPNIVTGLDKEKVDVNILYVSSPELFSYLSKKKQAEILPDELKYNAMAVTGFTIDTMYKYLLTEKGRDFSLHPFKKGVFLGSGSGGEVLKQAGLDVKSQIHAIKKFVENL